MYLPKPQSPRINWGNPLTRGLVWNALPSSSLRTELVKKTAGTLLTSGTWSGNNLMAVNSLSSSSTSNGGAAWSWSSPLDSIANKLTIVVWAKPDSIVDFTHFLCSPAHSTWTSPFVGFMLGTGSPAGKLNLQLVTTAGTDNNVSTATLIASGDPLTMYAATYDGTNIRFFVNGIFKEQIAAAHGGNINLGDKVEIVLSNRTSADNGEGLSGQIPWAGIWNRNLLDLEIMNLYINPWQFYVKPNYNPFYVPSPAAAPSAFSSTISLLGVG